MTDPRDFPLNAVAETAMEWVDKGATIFQKFTCSHCGARQTIDEPNKLFTSASCEECGKVTDITVSGCNYLVISPEITEIVKAGK